MKAGAENGVLTVMCGGDAAPYAIAEPVIAAFARACRLMGPSGAGQLTKMVNQICIAGLVEALSEGLHFAQKAGLDPNAVVYYTSGRASLETSYMYALMARMHGTNNLPDSSNMCHEPTSVGLKYCGSISTYFDQSSCK